MIVCYVLLQNIDEISLGVKNGDFAEVSRQGESVTVIPLHQ